MVKAGEVSGSLDQSLDKLASLLEFEEKVHMRIKAATRYPLIVVCAIFIGFMILTTLIVPRFANIYSQFQTALPLPTRILLGLNVAITKYWWLSGLCIAVFIFAFKKLINTKAGRLHWDGFKLKVPIFGPLVFKLIMARFTRITGTLMKSGVGLLEILDLASSGVGNEVIARTIKAIKKSVSEGRGLSEPMRQSKMFPAAVIQMVSVGEQTGKLDELLIHVSGYYDAQAEYTINNLTSLIEPVLILILGCAVLFMALGIFLPMWNMMNLFRG
jgi:MSHA biogenesis protein MshG